MGKPPKKKLIIERAHQYRVIAERHRENLPKRAAKLVRTAQKGLAEAAEVVEESTELP